jgi:hypothetical protein
MNLTLKIPSSLPSIHPLRAELTEMKYEVRLESETMKIQQNRLSAYAVNGWPIFLMGNVSIESNGTFLILKFDVSAFVTIIAIGIVALLLALFFPSEPTENHIKSVLLLVGTAMVFGSLISIATIVTTIRRDVKGAVKRALA